MMNEIDALVASFAADTADADDAEREAAEVARRAIRRAIAVEIQRESRATRSFRPARSPRFRRFALVAVVVLAILGTIAALPAIRGGGGRLGTATASATMVLERAAKALAQQPWRPLQPGEYDYIETAENRPPSGPAGTQPSAVNEAWIASNGSGRLVQRGSAGTVVIPFGQPKRVQLTPHAWTIQEPWTWPAGAGGVDYQQLINLPTDPAALLDWIEQRARTAGPSPDAEAFTIVGDLLRDSPAPPQLRAAMFRVVARLPGVQLVGPTTDELGRSGVAVGRPDGNVRHDLIFDPTTGSLLGERSVSLGTSTGYPTGTIMSWSVVEAEGIVHSDHQTPAEAHAIRRFAR